MQDSSPSSSENHGQRQGRGCDPVVFHLHLIRPHFSSSQTPPKFPHRTSTVSLEPCRISRVKICPVKRSLCLRSCRASWLRYFNQSLGPTPTNEQFRSQADIPTFTTGYCSGYALTNQGGSRSDPAWSTLTRFLQLFSPPEKKCGHRIHHPYRLEGNGQFPRPSGTRYTN